MELKKVRERNTCKKKLREFIYKLTKSRTDKGQAEKVLGEKRPRRGGNLFSNGEYPDTG